jgi:hypothetical protein
MSISKDYKVFTLEVPEKQPDTRPHGQGCPEMQAAGSLEVGTSYNPPLGLKIHRKIYVILHFGLTNIPSYGCI